MKSYPFVGAGFGGIDDHHLVEAWLAAHLQFPLRRLLRLSVRRPLTFEPPVCDAVTSPKHVELPAVRIAHEPRRLVHEVDVGPPRSAVVLRVDQPPQCAHVHQYLRYRSIDLSRRHLRRRKPSKCLKETPRLRELLALVQ